MEGDTPGAAFLDDVGQLQLADYIDPSAGVEANHRCPPVLRLLGPRDEGCRVDDGLQVGVLDQADRLLWINGVVFLGFPEGLHGRRDNGLSVPPGD